MKEEVMSLILAEDSTAYQIWTSIEEQLLPITVEKEGHLKIMLMNLRKGTKSLDDYLKEFKSICDNLASIKKPISDRDKVFQFAHGLGPKYMDFRIAMLTKPPYPSFSQFLLALQSHEQTLITQKEEENTYMEHAQVYFSQRGRGRNGRNGRGNFNSRGKGFTPAVDIISKMVDRIFILMVELQTTQSHKKKEILLYNHLSIKRTQTTTTNHCAKFVENQIMLL